MGAFTSHLPAEKSAHHGSCIGNMRRRLSGPLPCNVRDFPLLATVLVNNQVDEAADLSGNVGSAKGSFNYPCVSTMRACGRRRGAHRRAGVLGSIAHRLSVAGSETVARIGCSVMTGRPTFKYTVMTREDLLVVFRTARLGRASKQAFLMSQPANSTVMANRKAPMSGILIGTLGLLLSVALAILVFGGVSGEEFSPQTFTHRAYWYWQIPILRIQIWPVQRRQLRTDAVTDYLTKNKYLPTANGPIRWDLVQSSTVSSFWNHGDAAVLIKYLDALENESGSDFYWLAWTKKHRKSATLLWPAIARLARTDLYYLMPAVFDRAMISKDPSEFGQELNRLLASEYEQLGMIQMQCARFDQAEALFSAALTYDSGRTSSLRNRAVCRQKISNSSFREEPHAVPRNRTNDQPGP